jgi:hypothetical protein
MCRRYGLGRTQANLLGKNPGGRNEMELSEFEFVQPYSLQGACTIPGERSVGSAENTALMAILCYRPNKPAVYARERALKTRRETEQ